MIRKTKILYLAFSIVFMLSIFTGSDLLIFSFEAELVMLLGIIMLFDGLTKHRLFHLKPDRGLLVLFLCQVVYMFFSYSMFSLYPEKTMIFMLRHIGLIPFLLFSMGKQYLLNLLNLSRKYILCIVVVYYVMWVFWGNNGSFLNNYQYVAAYSSILVVLLLAKLFTYPSFTRKNIFEIILCLGALLLTGKRSYVLIILVIFFVGLFFLRSTHKDSKMFRLLVPLVFIFTLVMMVNPQLLSSITRLMNIRNDISLSGRTRLWDLATYLWSLNPANGVGYGIFSTYIENNRNFVYAMFGVQRTFAAHNIYIQLLAEIGIVGLVIFALFFIKALLACIKAIKNTNNSLVDERYILIVSLFMQLWFLLYGMSGNPLYMPGQFGLYLFSVATMRTAKYGIEQ